MDAYFGLSEEGINNRSQDLQVLYDYYNGVIRDNEYDYVTKPYGKSRKNFPSKIRNYPLIKPVIDLLLGEKAKRAFNYSVITVNSDSVDRKEEAKKTAALEAMKQKFANELNKQGVNTGVETEEVPPSKNMEEMFDRSYVDTRALIGQKAMNYLVQEQEVQEKLNKAWFHFLVSGEAFTMRTVRNDSVNYEVLNPLDVDYDMDPDLDYVEDGEWAMVTKYMNPSNIIEAWGKHLSSEQVGQIMNKTNGEADFYSTFSVRNDRSTGTRDRLTQVKVLYWQSLKRIGFVSHFDPETGDREEFVVDDGYRLPLDMKEEGATLEWEWHNEVWQGIRIGRDIDIDVRPFSEGAVSMDNPSKNKLPINGRRYSDINSNNISMCGLGIPYQLNYNVYKYRLETSIAKSKDIIGQFDINMIPKGWTMDKWMYYVDGSGVAWIDFNKEGITLSTQHQAVLDMSIKTIGMYIDLLAHIEQEWERVSGVNRQRRGEMSQYEGKATGQQAIVQSAHTTEDLYRKFGGMERRDLQFMLDSTKSAWKDGKKSAYVMPDGATDFLNVDPDTWMESDFGIFMSDATKEQEKFMMARDLGQAMLQNGSSTSMALEMIDSESFLELKSKIKEAEKQMQAAQENASKAEQADTQAERANKKKIHEDIMFDKDKERLHKADEGEKDRQNKIEVKSMDDGGAEVPVPPEDNSLELNLKGKEVKVKERAQKEIERHNKATETIAKNKPTPTSSQ
jgi:hypothetical protein